MRRWQVALLLVGVLAAVYLGVAFSQQDVTPENGTASLQSKAGESSQIISGDPIYKVDPKYPKDARKKKVEGDVVLDGFAGKDGKINSLTAVSGYPVLARSAVDGVS